MALAVDQPQASVYTNTSLLVGYPGVIIKYGST